MTVPRETRAKVEFRWREHEKGFADLLCDEAKKHGRSTADHARELLKDVLAREDVGRHEHQQMLQELAEIVQRLQMLQTLADGLKKVHQNIYELRDAGANATVKLLSDAGELSPQDAKRWVRESLAAD